MKVELVKIFPEKKIGLLKSEYGEFNAVVEDSNVINEEFECEIEIDKVLIWGEDIFPFQKGEMAAIYQKDKDVFFIGKFKKIDENISAISISKSLVLVEVGENHDYLGNVIIKVGENLVKVFNSNI